MLSISLIMRKYNNFVVLNHKIWETSKILLKK